MTSCSSSEHLGGLNPRSKGTARFAVPPARQSTKRLRSLDPLLVPTAPSKRPTCSPRIPAPMSQAVVPQLGLAHPATSSSTETAPCPTAAPNMTVIHATWDTDVTVIQTQFDSIDEQPLAQVPLSAPLPHNGVLENDMPMLLLIECNEISSPTEGPLLIEMSILNDSTGSPSAVSESCASKDTSSQCSKQEEVLASCMPAMPQSPGNDSPYHSPRHEVVRSGSPAASKSSLNNNVSFQGAEGEVVGSPMPATSVSSQNNDASFQSPTQEVVGSPMPATLGSSAEDDIFSKSPRQEVRVAAVQPFFRCTLGECKFASNEEQRFVRHLASHTMKELSALFCFYCRRTFDVITSLVQHMVKKHGRLCYQCGHCPYLSAFLVHLHVHLRHAHPGTKPLLFKCKEARGPGIPKPIGPNVQLAHYQCSVIGCSYQNRNPDRFVRHLITEHPAAKIYRCHLCSGAVDNVRGLLHHYTEHNIGKVQCVYCSHSEAAYEKMLLHLSDRHPDWRPKIFARTREQRDAMRKFIGDLAEWTSHMTEEEWEARTAGVSSTFGVDQRGTGRLVISRVSSDLSLSDEADTSPGTSSWLAATPGLACAVCKHVAPSAHLLRMHTLLRHSAGLSANRKASEVAKLLGDFLRSSLPTANKEQTSLSRRSKKFCAEGLVKLESQSDDNAQKQPSAGHADHTCTKCRQTFKTESVLHSHMRDKHHYFAVCAYCKMGCVNKRIMEEHLRKVHKTLKKCFVTLSQKRKQTEHQPAPKCLAVPSDTAFSWYNVRRDPVDMDGTYVMLQPASSETPMRVSVYNIFKLYNINPRIMVKDFATCTL